MINSSIYYLNKTPIRRKDNISKQQNLLIIQKQDSVCFNGISIPKKQLFVNTVIYDQIKRLANVTPENDATKLMKQIKILCEHNFIPDVHSNAWIFAFLLEPESCSEIKPILEEALRSTNSEKLKECFRDYIKVLGTGYLAN